MIKNNNKKKFIPRWVKKEDKGYTHASREGFYNTTRWKNVRNYILTEQPLCVNCLKEGKIRVATLVDHKIPITEENIKEYGMEWLGYHMDNLQGLCHTCHRQKTRRDNSRFSDQNLAKGRKAMEDLEDW